MYVLSPALLQDIELKPVYTLKDVEGLDDALNEVCTHSTGVGRGQVNADGAGKET